MTAVPEGGQITCGGEFQAPAAGELTMVARFPASVAAADGVVAGEVEVTSGRPIRGVVAPRAQVFVVGDGRVVSMPLDQDTSGVAWNLAPGTAERLPAEVTLVSCAAGNAPLPPGRYELWARLALTPDDAPAITSFGGPWPLEIT